MKIDLHKLSVSLFVIALALLIATIAACNSSTQATVSHDPVYRGEVSDSVYLRQADIESIANQLKGEVKAQNKGRETFTGLLVSVCLVLLGVQISINRSNNKINSSQASLVAVIGQEVKDIKEDVCDHEGRIRDLEGIKQKKIRS